MNVTKPALRIEPATERDVPLILRLIKGLAEYEKLAHEVVATEDGLRETLFGARPAAEVVIAYAARRRPASRCSSTTTRRSSAAAACTSRICSCVPEWRGHGYGRALLTHLARIARRARLRRLRVVGARLERAGDRLLQEARREADGRLDDLSRHRRRADAAGAADLKALPLRRRHRSAAGLRSAVRRCC